MRVVLALERTPREQSTLDPVLWVAKSMDATIEALLIQSERLTRYATLPIAREIDIFSGQARELTAANLDQAWLAERRRLEAALSSAPQWQAIRYSVQLTRGEVEESLRALNDEDESLFAFLVVGGLQPARLSNRASPIRAGKRSTIGVYVDQTRAAINVLDAATKIALSGAAELLVAVHPKSRELATAFLRDKAVRVRESELIASNISDIATALIGPETTALVMPASFRDAVFELQQSLAIGPERLLVLVR